MIFDATSGTTYSYSYLAGLTVSLIALVIVISASTGSSPAAYRDVTLRASLSRHPAAEV